MERRLTELARAKPSTGAPVERPTYLVEATERFRAGIIAAASGDVPTARELLRIDDADRIVGWCRAQVRPTTLSSRLRSAKLMRLLTSEPAETVDASELRDLLNDAHHRCPSCQTPLVHRDDLDALGRLVGDDVLSTSAVDDRDPGSWTKGDALWLLTCATVVATPTEQRGSSRGPEVTACCLPCRQRVADSLHLEPGRGESTSATLPERPDWVHLLEFLGLAPGTPRALVRHALLLDGSTLNISGDLRDVDTSAAPLVVTVVGGSVPLHIGVTTQQRRGIPVFHGWGDVAAAIESATSTGVLRFELRDTNGTRVVLITLPGALESPNRTVTTPIASTGSRKRTAEFTATAGLELVVSDAPTVADIVGVELADGVLRLDVERFPAAPDDAGPLEAVWLQRRGDQTATGRVEFTHGTDGRWSLDVDRRLLPREPEPAQLWDTWGSWRTNGALVTARAGRVTSDLVDLRDAVRLPSIRVDTSAVQLDVRPYFTVSKHFAVKTSVLEPS